jgi:predicted GIY-YIG superfamily endonuclease
MTHPALRREFDRLVRQFDAEVDLYRVRKAAFQLRKTRRLRPELISRIADWGKTVSTHPLKQLRDDIELVPEQPGVYLFQDDSGYLYIGESENLRDRLQQHLDQSHNLALARHLQGDADNVVIETHAFDPESRARLVRVRRAYESSLIASRKPKFNIQP